MNFMTQDANYVGSHRASHGHQRILGPLDSIFTHIDRKCSGNVGRKFHRDSNSHDKVNQRHSVESYVPPEKWEIALENASTKGDCNGFQMQKVTYQYIMPPRLVRIMTITIKLMIEDTKSNPIMKKVTTKMATNETPNDLRVSCHMVKYCS